MSYCAKVTDGLNGADRSLQLLDTHLQSTTSGLPSYGSLLQAIKLLGQAQRALHALDALPSIEQSDGQDQRRMNDLQARQKAEIAALKAKADADRTRADADERREIAAMEQSPQNALRSMLGFVLNAKNEPNWQGLLASWAAGILLTAVVVQMGWHLLLIGLALPLTLVGLTFLADEGRKRNESIVRSRFRLAKEAINSKASQDEVDISSRIGKDLQAALKMQGERVGKLGRDIAKRKARFDSLKANVASSCSQWTTHYS
jgi:hypothetical protein